MAQQINDNFSLLAGIPIDDRFVKTTIALRDAISSVLRYEGLPCYVAQTRTLYQLQGGISNSDWIGIAGQNVSLGFETEIDGFLALSTGKTTLLDWEVGDKFRGWIGSRYLVGSILSLPVSLPADIDNPAKVALAVDSAQITNVPKIQFTADGIQDTFDIGVAAQIKAVGWNGVLLNDDDWLQTGTSFTLTFVPANGDLIKPI